MAEKKVWLYCVYKTAGIGCGDNRNQTEYTVEDHLVHVEARHAYGTVGAYDGLLDHIEMDTRFNGRFQMPRAVYREAEPHEIEAFINARPALAEARHKEQVAEAQARRAEVEAQLAAIQAERDRLTAILDQEEAKEPAKAKAKKETVEK